MLSIIIILIGFFTLTAINPVYSIIGLISIFGCSALYLINLSLYFIGLSYLIIYVGAIAILFLFVIMMINTRVLELKIYKIVDFSPNLWIGSIAISPLFWILININDIGIIFDNIIQLNNELNIWNKSLILYYGNFDNIIFDNPIILLGYNLYGDKAILTLLSIMCLLLAMIGPIILTKK